MRMRLIILLIILLPLSVCGCKEKNNHGLKVDLVSNQGEARSEEGPRRAADGQGDGGEDEVLARVHREYGLLRGYSPDSSQVEHPRFDFRGNRYVNL